MRRQVIAYDFDGTITDVDTFPAFIHQVKGDWQFVAIFLLFSPILMLMKMKLYSADKAKEQIFSFAFKGTDYAQFEIWCKEFATKNRHILRPKALLSISDLSKMENVSLYVVSAGIKEWIYPMLCEYNFKSIIATEIEVDTLGKLTGRFKTKNCNREEKVKRFLDIEPNRSEYELVFYGDSSGDDAIVKFADRGYYNEFL